MIIKADHSDEQIMQEIGRRVQQNRLIHDIKQTELAEKAGVSVRTLASLERGEVVRADILIRVLRALDWVEGLNGILPEIRCNPCDLADLGKPRQRVCRKKIEPNKEWKWGDEI